MTGANRQYHLAVLVDGKPAVYRVEGPMRKLAQEVATGRGRPITSTGQLVGRRVLPELAGLGPVREFDELLHRLRTEGVW